MAFVAVVDEDGPDLGLEILLLIRRDFIRGRGGHRREPEQGSADALPSRAEYEGQLECAAAEGLTLEGGADGALGRGGAGHRIGGRLCWRVG